MLEIAWHIIHHDAEFKPHLTLMKNEFTICECMWPELAFSETGKDLKSVSFRVWFKADSDNIKNIYYKVIIMNKAKTI